MIDDIRAKIVRGRFEFSKHAVDQTIIRGVTFLRVRLSRIIPMTSMVPVALSLDKRNPAARFTCNAAIRRAKSSKSLPSMNLIQICGWTLSGE